MSGELVAAGDEARQAELERNAVTREKAINALAAEVGRRKLTGDPPLLITKAERFLVTHALKRLDARQLVREGGGGRWRLEPLDDRSTAVVTIEGVSLSTAAGFVSSERAPRMPGSTLWDSADRMGSGRPNSETADTAPRAAISTEAISPRADVKPEDEGEV